MNDPERMRAADAFPDDGDSGSDPQIEALMRERFGPELGQRRETDEERSARGLAQVDALQSAYGGKVRWLHQDLQADRPDLPLPVCFGCGAAGARSACAKCGVAMYCGRACQVADWKRGHKAGCAALHALGPSQRLATAEAVRAAADGLVAQLRLYLLPFAAQHGGAPKPTTPPPPPKVLNKTGAELAPQRHPPSGFVFLQSETSLDGLSLPTGLPPRDCSGRELPQPRNVLLHFVTLPEFDSQLVKALPALAGARPALVAAMGEADGAAEAVRGPLPRPLHSRAPVACFL